MILFCHFRWKTVPILWHRCCSPTLIEQPLQTVDWWFNYSLLQLLHTTLLQKICHLMSTHEMQKYEQQKKLQLINIQTILSYPPQIFNNNIWFKPFSFWFFVRSWVSIILRDFMQNTNNFQADTTFFRTSDNLFEIKTHYTLKNTVFFYGAHTDTKSQFLSQNSILIKSTLNLNFPAKNGITDNFDFLNLDWDFATVCVEIFLGIFDCQKHWKRAKRE